MKPYLRVRNWTKFQHYKVDLENPDPKKRRRLAWVKYHLDELDDDDFLDLPHAAQLLFHRLLLLEARAVNRGSRGFRSDIETIATKVRMDSETVAEMLPLLLEGAWLSEAQTSRVSSSSLANRSRVASVEVEVEVEVEKALGPPHGNGKSNPDQATPAPPPKPYDPYRFRCTECGVKTKTEREVRDHLDNVHWLEGQQLNEAVAQAGREAGTA